MGAVDQTRFKADMIAALPRLQRFARRMTGSTLDADDLLQEGCAAALQKWHLYDPAQPLDRWMFRILRNLWLSELRKRRVRTGAGQIPAEDAGLTDDTPDADPLQARQLQGAMAALPRDLSLPLLLVCAEGYSYRETADLLDVPIGTVMSRLHRARKHLAARLSKEDAL